MRRLLEWAVLYCLNAEADNVSKMLGDSSITFDAVTKHRFYKRYNRWRLLGIFLESFVKKDSKILRYKRWKIFGYLWDER